MVVDLESLRCFVMAAQHLNFRVASRMVALSPAAFGERIKRLERELGARLFERTTRRVTLTQAGERLWPHASNCLQQAGRCAEVVLRESPQQRFELTIGTRFELGMSWLTPALSGLERRHPERSIHLFFGDTQAQLHALRAGNIDCAVTSARLTQAGLRYARLHPEEYVFVGKPQLLDANPLKQPSDAAAHRLLELNGELPLFRYFLDARPGREVWAFDRTQYLGTIGPIRKRLLEGAGVAVVPRYFVAPDLARQKLRAILPKVKMPRDWFRLVWLEGHPREQKMHELASELSELTLR